MNTARRAGRQFVLMAGSASMGSWVVSLNRWCCAKIQFIEPPKVRPARRRRVGEPLVRHIHLANRNCRKRNVTGPPTQWCRDYRPGMCALAAGPAGQIGCPHCGPEKRPPRFEAVLVFYARVAAMTALMVCIRFSASSKTMDAALSKTSSVTSMQSMPNFW